MYHVLPPGLFSDFLQEARQPGLSFFVDHHIDIFTCSVFGISQTQDDVIREQRGEERTELRSKATTCVFWIRP